MNCIETVEECMSAGADVHSSLVEMLLWMR